MLAAIDAAVQDIRIEIYIFEDDVSGRAIAEALARAAQRGVAVRLLIDGFGSLKAPETFFDAMRAAGVDVLVYRPLRGKWFPTRHRMRRVHRKIVLVDGKVGFLGGINFIDDFTENLSTTHPRYDYAVKVEGPVLAPIYESVYRLWRGTKWFTKLRRGHDGVLPIVASQAVGDTPLAFVSRDNVKHRRNIEQAYRAAISSAKSEVLIAKGDIGCSDQAWCESGNFVARCGRSSADANGHALALCRSYGGGNHHLRIHTSDAARKSCSCRRAMGNRGIVKSRPL
jgi:cardiolipin synthase